MSPSGNVGRRARAPCRLLLHEVSMKPTRTFISALIALLLAACGGGDTGKVTVMLKDAPASFAAAVVTISEVDLVGSGGTTVLSTAKVTTDLLTLANDTAKLVDAVEVPIGT